MEHIFNEPFHHLRLPDRRRKSSSKTQWTPLTDIDDRRLKQQQGLTFTHTRGVHVENAIVRIHPNCFWGGCVQLCFQHPYQYLQSQVSVQFHAFQSNCEVISHRLAQIQQGRWPVIRRLSPSLPLSFSSSSNSLSFSKQKKKKKEKKKKKNNSVQRSHQPKNHKVEFYLLNQRILQLRNRGWVLVGDKLSFPPHLPFSMLNAFH